MVEHALSPINRVCRARVVRAFPNPASANRLVGAVLADMHACDRRHLGESSMALLDSYGDNGPIAATDSGDEAARTTSKPAGRRPARRPEIMEL